jgi:hypothetical protein
MIIQSGRKLGFKKTIRQGRAMRLGNHRNVIKGTFFTVSKKTPFHKKRFVQITFENDSKDIRPGKKELQDKIG